MTGRLQDRVAIVTGAGDGIGLAVARRFAFEGARVVVAEIDGDRGEAVAASLAGEFGAAAVAVRTDVAVRGDVEGMVERALAEWGGVDILVNNAWGGGALGRLELKDESRFDAGFHVGFYGPLWAMQAAFPSIRDHGFGRIISMCSLNGVNAHIGTAEYNSAKEALRTLHAHGGREWAQYGITANVICPGAKTAASRRVFAQNPELEAAADASNPMGRLGGPRDRHRPGRAVPRERREPVSDRQHPVRRRRLAHQRCAVGTGSSRQGEPDDVGPRAGPGEHERPRRRSSHSQPPTDRDEGDTDPDVDGLEPAELRG